MKLSAAGVHLIAGFEGFRPHAYNDAPVSPNCTIGYGHELHAGACGPTDAKLYWTVDQALEKLLEDCGAAQKAVNFAVKVRLGVIPARAQARYDALVSLAFNIGGGAFAASSLVHAINLKGAPRDWTPIGPYWLEWDHDGGQVIPGLLNRRRAEFAIFAAGVYPSV